MSMKHIAVFTGGGIFVFLLLTLSTFSLMLLFWSFFAGIALCTFILRPDYKIPNLLRYHMNRNLAEKQVLDKKHVPCSVCGQQDCKRERSISNMESLVPWLGIYVNETVDQALKEFIELMIERYVWKWYRDLSEDDTFVNELKIALRHLLSALYLRVNKVDLSELILKKLLKIAIIHADICIKAGKIECCNGDDIIMWYGNNLHPALKSRRSEVTYLRSLCDALFPHLFPPSLVKSRVGRTFLRELLSSNVILFSMDVIADPDKVNNLLLIFFDRTPPREPDNPPSPVVPLLSQIIYKDQSAPKSVLNVDLPKIMSTQDQLYQLMTFLKTVGAVHLLQFCLTVQDFNNRCLSQEQDNNQQEKLHEEACNIYESYCRANSPTFIHFEEDIVNELQAIAHGPPHEVCRLRTSTPLFRAYDHVYNLLEQIYCPLFYQSDIYYNMVCGDCIPVKQKETVLQRRGINRSSDKDALKKSMKRKPSKVPAKACEFSLDDNDSEPDTNLMCNRPSRVRIEQEDKNSEIALDEEIEDDWLANRNLSTWRVSVPSLTSVPRRDDGLSTSNERIYAFFVEVKRVDVVEGEDEPDQWHVLRRYNEFYVLESRLYEFHDGLHIASLPPKKLFLRSPSKEYLESKRADFERFLKDLLSQVTLCRSELLYHFLRPHQAGAARFYGKVLPDVNLGKLFRRVPNKLIKEKGQHLDVFLQSFIQSCEAPKPKPGKYPPLTEHPDIQMDQKIHNELYPESDWQTDSFQSHRIHEEEIEHPTNQGIFDYLIYIATQVFQADWWVKCILICFKRLFQNTVEPFTYMYLKSKIDRYRMEHHVVDLIHLFRDILFHNNDLPRTLKEKEERKKLTYQQWKEFVPGTFSNAVGPEKHEEGCKRLFEVLQQPKLNKQLSYLLLDAFLTELFPEMKVSPSDKC
ncbi:sorting nexin-14-like isoform X1 [Clavelina lepadiformis]|uniref:sorting nexin-14-like isoform X1 n=1 Tax=Clavelina lepadiformis TaxID=159417 RepID=UPI0040411C34